MLDKNGERIVFLSLVKDKKPLSNKRSNVGVKINPLNGSVFSKLSEEIHGFMWLAISNLSSETNVIGQKGHNSKSFLRYSP